MKLVDDLLGKAVLVVALPVALVLAISITVFKIPYDFKDYR